jgi:hypothetical protein
MTLDGSVLNRDDLPSLYRADAEMVSTVQSYGESMPQDSKGA